VTTIRLLGPGESAALDRVAEGVFANPVDPRRAAEFFADLSVVCQGDPPTDLDPGGSARETLPPEASHPRQEE
jgi:hypothetical protein